MKTEIEQFEELNESFKKLVDEIKNGGYLSEDGIIYTVNEALLFKANCEEFIFASSLPEKYAKEQFEDSNIIINKIFPLLARIEMNDSFDSLIGELIGHEKVDQSKWIGMYREELKKIESDLITLSKEIGSLKLAKIRSNFIDCFVFYILYSETNLPKINFENKAMRGTAFEFMKDTFDRLIEMSELESKSTYNPKHALANQAQ